MLKKIVLTALTAGFALTSFAQAGAGAPGSLPAQSGTPAAAEQGMDAPVAKKKHAAKKHHHKHHHAKKKSHAPK